ncbi:MAG: hypothetical protein WAN50_00455 [Minisyncoccia bacterium]
MSWATKRRLFILLIIGSVVAAFLAVVLIATFYKSPSCSDGVQNQGETGIDCGGPCPYRCALDEQPPVVLFTQVLPNNGRTDIIASVENKNIDAAAKDVPYTIALYDANHAHLRDISGMFDLPAAQSVPIFVPNVFADTQIVVASAFLTVDPSAPKWFSMTNDPRIVPSVSNITQTGTAAAPRIEAVLSNPSATLLNDVLTIVVVKDMQGNVIAASQTIVPLIPAQGQATATFTWNGAFSTTTASIQVTPIIPFPD